jgi:hypothetical protein
MSLIYWGYNFEKFDVAKKTAFSFFLFGDHKIFLVSGKP